LVGVLGITHLLYLGLILPSFDGNVLLIIE